ncbi:retron system putative HNH endonuclease [Rhizobium sp. AG207R]|uniref:retron system putative HNH endonuclease n=1 Tax=Rhizobium sp. AG207R TaxID=2802287 RepID=UPI0022ABFB51|nr:retron system putative HNH endonuclease [Rhizobium sp. AG207R]MCZ3375803.1 TIGR02646 family protein [Rhizobium sp. AG207R]
MKGSRKLEPPLELVNWLAQANEDWQPAYPFDSPAVRDAVRNALYQDQRGVCVYCGRKLSLSRPGKTYHIEHFRPQTTYPTRAVAYENLFLSCGQEDGNGGRAPTCGSVKGDWFDELANIYPAYSECTARFRFTLNGEAVPATDGDMAATEMIEHLKLNHPELRKDREDVLRLMDEGTLSPLDYWNADDQIAESYAHVAFQHLGQTIP